MRYRREGTGGFKPRLRGIAPSITASKMQRCAWQRGRLSCNPSSNARSLVRDGWSWLDSKTESPNSASFTPAVASILASTLDLTEEGLAVDKVIEV
jgi:hypothetical protein